MRGLLLILLLVITAVDNKAAAQMAEGWTEAKAARVAKKQLVYLWIGNGCSEDAASKYGFKFRNIGCVAFPKHIWHNRVTVLRINLVYGWRWFEKHRLEIAYGPEYKGME
ncbi:hypothetical protein MUN81_09080 [Hymenobacter sp. 5317J-9]|uniref:hypothetical protein n=1 Tax=Hymenobacter sp. 5317J-9 TaxID=2932250 RepID=UPI001FD64E5B|nr:hypothetical protein [Hymenobacter sp. 5317J-9]UOQ99630.1 hypothetical protein MUN81_09080 [Hymenobacter sp. 5317J-9]